MFHHCTPRALCRGSGARGLENALGEFAALHDGQPQLALLDLVEDAQRRGVRRLAPQMLFAQPRREIANARRRPHGDTRVAPGSLGAIEQDRRELCGRREDRRARREGGPYVARNARRVQRACTLPAAATTCKAGAAVSLPSNSSMRSNTVLNT